MRQRVIGHQQRPRRKLRHQQIYLSRSADAVGIEENAINRSRQRSHHFGRIAQPQINEWQQAEVGKISAFLSILTIRPPSGPIEAAIQIVL
jgi:hypothetical protein